MKSEEPDKALGGKMNPDFHRLLDSLSQRKSVLHVERIRACIEDSRDLAVHGEEGIAFENLCQNLFEWDFPLRKDDYAVIERLGRHYRFQDSTWNFLAKLLESTPRATMKNEPNQPPEPKR